MKRLKLWEKLVLVVIVMSALAAGIWRQLPHNPGQPDLAIIYTADTNGYLEGCG